MDWCYVPQIETGRIRAGSISDFQTLLTWIYEAWELSSISSLSAMNNCSKKLANADFIKQRMPENKITVVGQPRETGESAVIPVCTAVASICMRRISTNEHSTNTMNREK
jgi:hypothetical protein